MLKEFFTLLDWFRVVIVLRLKTSKVLFKEGEVWWCSVGMNVGVEIYGKGPKFTRPVLILKKFNADSFLGVPLTSRHKISDWYISVAYADHADLAVLNQAKIFDAKRLLTRMGALTDGNLQNVKRAFLNLHKP
jgi:mRNA interferase MazF